MAAVEEEEIVPGSPWYTKFFEYWRNRNRVGPGKVELPDCDFFIVGPRRTLRVLRPSLKSGWYYENTNDRPESIIDNFFTRWSRRPHSSSNCRCSFRRSSRLSTTEEQIISAELNRIRTSLCEAEGNGRAIEELEKRVSVNLQKLQVPVAEAERNDADDKTDDTGKTDPSTTEDDQQEADEQTIKNKIVKDLERYINMLLEEILDDTVKYVAKAEDGLLKETIQLKKRSPRCSLEGLAKATSKRHEGDSPITKKQEAERSSSNEGSFNDINFSFHSNRMENASDKQSEYKNEVYAHGGYVNRAFIGSTSDPDALDFYLRQSMNTEVTLEQMDCVDSGINSVETIEFQPDQEPSLEQSLMRIINEKFGRTTLRTSWEDLSSTGEQEKERPSSEVRKDSIRRAASGEVIPGNGEHLSNERATERSTGVSGKNDAERSEPQDSRPPENAAGPDISPDNLELEEDPLANLEELEETVNEHSFEKLRLEFKDSDERPSLRAKKVTTMGKLREKFKAGHDASDSKVKKRCWLEKIGSLEVKKGPVTMEMEDYKEKWEDLGEQLTENPDSFVTFRKNRKPMIVFLHGFGSSAEIFEHQLQYFSTLGYPCIAPEMLGHGMSSAPDRSRDYHFSKLLRDLDAVLCHYAFKPGQKCVIVAHNYGCSFATALAGKYENSIHQLVLISGGGPTPLAAPSTESAGHCCLRAVLAPFLMCGLHRDILYSAKGRQHPYCGLESSEQWPSHMKYVLDGMNWPEGDYVFHRRICTPTLLIHGLRDNKVSLVQECQMERTMLKAFLEAIPAAGHSPMTECPEQLNHMIQCFIDLWKNKKW